MALNEQVIGAAVIEIRADLDRLSKDFKKAQGTAKRSSAAMAKSTGTLNQALAKVGKRILAMGAAYATVRGGMQLVSMIKDSLSFADSIGKTADKLGVSTDALQEFRFAAEASGVPIRTLDMGLQRFIRRAQEAQANTGEAKDALAELKIELFEVGGAARKGEELFADAMDALAGTEVQKRLRLAFKLFDSEGVALVVMAERMEALRAKAREMGAVLDEELIRNAEKSKETLDALAIVMKVDMTAALVGLAPHIIQAAKALSILTKAATNVLRRFTDLQKQTIQQLTLTLTEAVEKWVELNARLEKQGSGGQFSALAGAVEAQDQLVTKIKEELDARRAAIEGTESELEVLTAAFVKQDELNKLVAKRGDFAKKLHRAALAAQNQIAELATQDHEERLRQARELGIVGEQFRQVELDSLAILGRTIDDLRQDEADLIAKLAKDQEKLGKEWAAAADFVEATFSQALAQMVLTGENAAKAIADAFVREMLSRAIRIGIGSLITALASVFQGVFGGGVVSGFTPNPNLPGFARAAHGGFRSGLTVVGERGPELVDVGPNAAITSTAQLRNAAAGGRGGSNVVVNVNNFGKDQVEVEKGIGTDGQVQIDVIVARAAAKDIRRGGLIAQEIGARFGSRRVGGAV